MNEIELTWELGYSHTEDGEPDEWVPASVPGAVQLDWARAKGWPDWWIGKEYERYGWMEDVWWTYRTTVPKIDLAEGEELDLQLGWVDHQGTLTIDPSIGVAPDKYFEGKRFNRGAVSRYPREAVEGSRSIEVRLAPVSKAVETGGIRNREEWSATTKQAVSYGWDFHPRLIPLGIPEPIRLLHRRKVIQRMQIERPTYLGEGWWEVRPNHGQAFDTAHRVRLTLLDADGSIAETTEPERRETRDGFSIPRPGLRVHEPDLWWPRGHGEPTIYTLRCECWNEQDELICDASVRFGFRSVRLSQYPGQWGSDPDEPPKQRIEPPATFEINDRRIFAKGANWVGPDVFPCNWTEERYRELLTLAADANFNCLRCWGGSSMDHEIFFDLCDELGIMVWQEFPLACSDYSQDIDYVSEVWSLAYDTVDPLVRHPSVVLWCGGNELFNAWSKMDDQHKALRQLNAWCFDHDRDTPFIPTSPLMGMGHGNYLFRTEAGKEVYELYPATSFTALPEFGVPGPANVETLREIIPEEELWPPKLGTNWEWHHGINAWGGSPDSWLKLETIESYFGAIENLEDLVEKGQWLQAEGLRFIFEEARRQSPRCAMALSWCYNEPWPTAANNAMVAWPVKPKPAYYAVKEALRSSLFTAKIQRFAYAPGDVFEADLWLLNDGPEPVEPCELIAKFDGGEVLRWACPGVSPLTNLQGPTLRGVVPKGDEELRIELVAGERSSTYRLVRKSARDPAALRSE